MRPPASHLLGARVVLSAAMVVLLAAPLQAQFGASTIEANPSSVAADGSSSSEIIVTARFFGVPVSGQDVQLSTDLGDLDPDTPIDNGDGTYTTFLTSTAFGTATITGTVNGNSFPDDAQVTFTAAALEFGVQPANTEVDEIITPAITVRAVDTDGNTVTTFTEEIEIQIGNNPGGGDLGGDDTQDAVNGVATFDGLSIDEIGNGYTLTATASGLSSATSAPFDITAGVAVALEFDQQPTNTTAGATITPAVTVRAVDDDGEVDTNFAGNITVALGTNPGGDGVLDGTTTRPAVNGVATFNDLNIDEVDNGYTLTASATGLTGDTSNNFDITAGAAVALQFQQQPTSTQAGVAITPAVTVRAVDAGNNTATGFSGNVTIALQNNPGGDGVLDGTTTRQAVNGVATFNDLNIDEADNGYTLRVTATGLTGATSTGFNITPGPPSPATSQITAAPATIVADGVSTSTITVQLRDQFGNNLTSGGATVTLATTAGTLTPSPGTPLTHVGNGQYTATLRSTTTAQTATVTGTVNGSSIADNATVTFVAGSAARLQFQQQPPASAVAGAAFTITVRAVDANNNTVTSFNGPVTVSIGANPGGGTLSGTTIVAAVNGVATFPGLSIDKTGAGYTLVADASGSGLVGATSNAFNVVAGPPSGATSTITADPTEIPADGTSTSTITVDLRDSFGNDITTGGVPVVLSTSAGTLGPVTDNADGTYSATLLSETVSQTALITGTVNGQTIADDASVTFTSGSATTLDVLVQPSDTPVVETIAPPVTVRVADGSGNTVTSFTGNVTVALAPNTTGATLQGTLTVAAVNGVATFSNLSIDRTGSYALRFTSPGVASVTSATFSITGGAPSAATTTISADPTTIATDGASTSTITVQLKDAAGNDVTTGGNLVRLTTTAGSLGSVSDNGNGTYTATLTSTTTPQTATIQGTLDGNPIADTATVTFSTGGTDLEVTVTASNPTPAEGSTLVYTVTVRNRGPEAATEVQVTDDLPDRVTFVSADPSQGSYDAPTGVWSVGTLASGASATLELTVTVEATSD